MQLTETLSVATYCQCEEQECVKEIFSTDCDSSVPYCWHFLQMFKLLVGEVITYKKGN